MPIKYLTYMVSLGLMMEVRSQGIDTGQEAVAVTGAIAAGGGVLRWQCVSPSGFSRIGEANSVNPIFLSVGDP
jgi:hypothetical protein